MMTPASRQDRDMPLKDLAKFDAAYDSSHEDTALQTRGVFIRRFPLHSLDKLALEDYVVGHGQPTFCNLAESGTKAWANIQGATSRKFGIYFGKTKKRSHAQISLHGKVWHE